MSESKSKYWSRLIAEQEAGGQKIGQFCREHGIAEASFYYWRKRLRRSAPVRFAVLETAPAEASRTTAALELEFRNGERLHIGHQVDADTLRLVLDALRG